MLLTDPQEVFGRESVELGLDRAPKQRHAASSQTHEGCKSAWGHAEPGYTAMSGADLQK